jgi:DNA adenine methylase
LTAPHPIPYQGSKRKLAGRILKYFPKDTGRLVEPFAGSAAVSLAAAVHGKAHRFHLNDINKPLMGLWDNIIDHPQETAEAYRRLWEAQLGNERAYYDSVRKRFNDTQASDALLYLLARCVKASVRYNANGEFNQSPDNRRKGAHPDVMGQHIRRASALLKGKTVLSSVDYRAVLEDAKLHDLIYMDPPYQGVCANRDARYLSGISFDEFVAALEDLNARDASYIISYDGRTGGKRHGRALPASLRLAHIEVDAGRSSQATLLGRAVRTYESLYLSPALTERLGGATRALAVAVQQATLFPVS